jgi:hypothetical protein
MLGLLLLAERTIRESVAQGFEIAALGALPASMASIGSQLVVRQRRRRGAVRARRAVVVRFECCPQRRREHP